MNPFHFFLSIRWKIIFVASLVLTLTGGFFIWQQHKLQLAQLDADQARFRQHSEKAVAQLFEFQADRMQMLARVLVEHETVRAYLLHHQRDKLIATVEDISTELSFAQGVAAVVFHDAQQHPLAVWGNMPHPEQLNSLVALTIQQEIPKSEIKCEHECVYQVILPIVEDGKTIGTVALVASLENIILDLRRLMDADVAVLNGFAPTPNPFLAQTRIHSVSGGAPMHSILHAARTGVWSAHTFRVQQDDKIYQVIDIRIPVESHQQPWLAVISDMTAPLTAIHTAMRHNLQWGAGVLGFAILLLYTLLHPAMRRIQHVSRVLPLLGEEQFETVRQLAHPHHCCSDEMDTLESLARSLADQLEHLNMETHANAASLAAQALQLEQERDFIAGLLDTAPVLILSYNQQGEIQLANQYALDACGLAFSTLMGKNFSTLFLTPQQPDAFAQMLELTRTQVCRSESSIKHLDGRLHDVVWFHTRLTLGAQEDLTFLSIGMDVSKQKQQAAEIHSLAFYDPLTRLPNRHLLLDRLKHIQAQTLHQDYCALIVINIDRFKMINDTKGHNVGNWLLIEIAKRLQNSVDDVSTIVRLGGDEFVVLLEELGADAPHAAIQAKLTCEMLREVIGQTYLWQNLEIHCTSSFGVSLFTDNHIPVEELLKQAEIALHYAKQAGRNTLRFFDPDMQTMLEARTTLEADLRTSLPRNQFKLFYQLQINALGQAVGAECLLRWIHPQRGLVSPMHFIPLAEETHLILPIGQWVLETACQQIKAWEQNPLTENLQLAVNVSARQFHQADFVAQVLHTIAQAGANPARLKIELTESTILDNILETISKMEALRQHGVHFSMDDFGTGYSSLAYLTQLPLNQLKIDQAFVRNLGVKSNDAIIVQTIISMAKNLGMDVIAEGVETLGQRNFLEQAGCTTYQGYLFSKPLPLADFMNCLSRFGEIQKGTPPVAGECGDSL